MRASAAARRSASSFSCWSRRVTLVGLRCTPPSRTETPTPTRRGDGRAAGSSAGRAGLPPAARTGSVCPSSGAPSCGTGAVKISLRLRSGHSWRRPPQGCHSAGAGVVVRAVHSPPGPSPRSRCGEPARNPTPGGPSSTKQRFFEDVDWNRLERKLVDGFGRQTGGVPNDRHRWADEHTRFSSALRRAHVDDDMHLAIEYRFSAPGRSRQSATSPRTTCMPSFSKSDAVLVACSW
jgi:hypothetical protein